MGSVQNLQTTSTAAGIYDLRLLQIGRCGGCPLVSASVATLGHVRGRGPMDTSSAEQDEVDIGRDGADAVGGTEPRPRGFPSLTEAARHPDVTEGDSRTAEETKKG
ncbi:MAG: hypothetical protein J5498_00650 [Bacteroidales bacterium]|nr:hypothetical protein [Bacteroidales bacterium]